LQTVPPARREGRRAERRLPCPRYSTCQFANVVSMREALRVWQSFYCDGMYRRCERFKLAEAGSDVPSRLLPNGRLQEEQPLANGAARGRLAR